MQLRRWCDIVLVAPCSANTLAKINHGICDNILVRRVIHERANPIDVRNPQTSLLRALPSFVPVLLFPAMNTHMFSHPLTARQLKMVKEELGYEVHGPIGKKLACGDIGSLPLRISLHVADRVNCTGIGAMYEWSDLVNLVVQKYGLTLKETT